MIYTLNDNVSIVNRPNICLDKILNLDVVACYLKYGLLPPPGNKGFLSGEDISKYELVDINRTAKSDYEDVLHVLKNTCTQIIKKAKLENRAVVLMLTSGLDSRLLYNIFISVAKQENYLDEFYNVTGNISGWDGRYSEADKLKSNWDCTPVNHSIVEVDFNNFESDVRDCNMINNRPINGLVSVVLKQVYKYISQNWLNPMVVTGIGEGVFFSTGGDQFLEKYSDHNDEIKHQVYASDTATLGGSDYLTIEGSRAASRHFNNIKEFKVFEWINLYERFIHRQQFFSDAPKVNWENSSYVNHYNLEMSHPYIDSDLLNTVLNLPSELLYDGTSKSTVRNLVEHLEGVKASDGIKMTSPQREILAIVYRDRVYELIESSILASIGVVKKDLIRLEFSNYIDDFNRLEKENKFDKINSYSVWKFVSAELWVRSILRRR
jgi:asparagine synthetase B (glutamine-hydrolysing)